MPQTRDDVSTERSGGLTADDHASGATEGSARIGGVPHPCIVGTAPVVLSQQFSSAAARRRRRLQQQQPGAAIIMAAPAAACWASEELQQSGGGGDIDATAPQPRNSAALAPLLRHDLSMDYFVVKRTPPCCAGGDRPSSRRHSPVPHPCRPRGFLRRRTPQPGAAFPPLVDDCRHRRR